MNILKALSPDCQEAVRMQSDALERKLPLLQRIRLRIHLWMCVWCRRYGKQIGFLRVAAKHCADSVDELPGRTLSDEARERIKRALAKDSEQT